MARDDDESIQDAATLRWVVADLDVAPALMDLARTAPQEKYRIRARGYLRVIRQMDLPDTDKLAMFRQAFEAATRSEERLLAVETSDGFLRRGPDEVVNAGARGVRSTRLRRGGGDRRALVHDQRIVDEPMRRVLAATMTRKSPAAFRRFSPQAHNEIVAAIRSSRRHELPFRMRSIA